MRLRYFFFLWMMSWSFLAQAQSILLKQVQIPGGSHTIEFLLEELSKQTGCRFSYNPLEINRNAQVIPKRLKGDLKEVLSGLFPDQNLSIKVKGQVLILKLTPLERFIKVSGTIYELQREVGYLDQKSNLPIQIPDASIFLPQNLASTVSANTGRFELRLKRQSAKYFLQISKLGYLDTVVEISALQNVYLDVYLSKIQVVDTIPKIRLDTAHTDYVASILPNYVPPVGDSSFYNPTSLKVIPAFQRTNVENIQQDFYRTTQVSLLPFIGNHGALSGKVINKYSFNVVGGFTGGTEAFEFGTAFNINKRYMHGFQIAGGFNAVGLNVKGSQIGGGINIVGGHVDGFQMVGGVNLVRRKFEGFQLAGGINFVGDTLRGFQLAGGVNQTIRGAHGMQMAGGLNINTGDVKAFQIAGGFNFNAKSFKGLQVAPLNFSSKNRGLQVGLINISGVNKGASIGIINISMKNGYHKIDLGINELGFAEAKLRTGTQWLQSNLIVGMRLNTETAFLKQPFTKPNLYMLGYGFGLNPWNHRFVDFAIDISATTIRPAGNLNTFNMLNRANFQLSFRLGDGVKLYFGPSYNIFLTRITDEEAFPLFAVYKAEPVIIEDRAINTSLRMRTWIGATAGLRLF